MAKRLWISYIMVTFVILAIIFYNPISDKLVTVLDTQNKIFLEANNDYKRPYSYYFVENVDEFVPYSYQGLINIIYTVLNNGWDTFTFYCPVEYTDCIDDIKKITNDNDILSHINNFAHPYNNFNNIQTTINSSGQIIIDIQKLYLDSHISEINFKVTEIMNRLITDDMDVEDKIKVLHDYLITNVSYDMDKVNGNSAYNSNSAYGSLIQGHAICSGYADAMAIFLTRLGIPNFKVSSETHVWNAVYINNKWYHLDATWDDQIDLYGRETLIHKFFLINSDNLKKYATTDHTFDLNYYQEFLYN